MTDTVNSSSKNSERTWEDLVPSLIVIASSIVFIGGTILSMVYYKTANGGYKPLEQFFSELGVRNDYIELKTGDTFLAPHSHEWFNATLVLAGFLIIPFFPLTWRQMNNKSKTSRISFRIAVSAGTLSGPAMIGVGLIDLSVTHISPLTNHGVWAFLLYLLITINSLAWAFGLFFAKGLPYKDKELAGKIWLEIIYVAIMVVIMVLSLGYHVYVATVDQTVVQDSNAIKDFPIEIFQKVIAYSFFIYYLFVGIKLMNPKYDNS